MSIDLVGQRRTARRSLLPLLLLGAGWLCASPSHAQVKGAWADGASRDRTFSRVLVVGISPDLNQRCAFERAMAAILKSESTEAYVSCDVMPQRAELNRENVEAAVAAKNADAVLATSLISQEWDAKEGGTRETRGFGVYKAVDSYYGVYGTVVAAEFQTAAPLTTIQGEARLTSKLYETSGATVVYTVDMRIRDIEARGEGIAEATPAIGKKLRREKLIR
jgi:hypothetical protein